MTTDLKSILEDLYALAPELREQERALVPILEQLLKAKPDAEPDPAFVEHLKMMLREKAASDPSPAPVSFLNFLTMPKFSYALSGALAGVVLAVPAVYIALRQGSLPVPAGDSNQPAIFAFNVSDAGPEAFGDLSTQNLNIAAAPAGYGAGGRGGGGDTALTTESAPSNEQQADDGVALLAQPSPAAKMIAPDSLVPPDFVEYNFKLEGDLPELTQKTVDVFKRQKGMSKADAGSILRLANIGLVDLSTFESSKVDSLSFYQDAPYGYTYSIAFREGNISVYQNWDKWPHPESSCQSENCFSRYRIDPEDIPADETLIAITDEFVRTHKIDISRYGEPQVDKAWQTTYESMSAADKSNFSIGETVRVVYPYLLEGKPVFDESGGANGISIGVNVREKKVQDAWGIMDRSYLKSAYPAVTDPSQITRFFEESGTYPPNVYPANAARRAVQITLGAPEVGYVLVNTFDNNQPDELLVPALIFPVTNVPEGEHYYRSSVSVPLAQDILEKMFNREMDYRAL